MRADAVIVSGTADRAGARRTTQAVQAACELPVLLGSRVSAENLARFWGDADGFIVGSSLSAAGAGTPRSTRRVAALVAGPCGCKGGLASSLSTHGVWQSAAERFAPGAANG
jgi:predicted TIM-barrel enzyme